MTHTAAQLHSLVAACEQFRGAKAPDGYRDGLALCVIDGVQSTASPCSWSRSARRGARSRGNAAGSRGITC